MKRKLILCFLAGGKIDNQPKCFIKTPNNKTILEEEFEIFNRITYDEYNIELENIIILYPKNYEKLEFTKLFEKNGISIDFLEGGETLQETINNVILFIQNKEVEDNTFICFISTDTPLINHEAIDDIIKRFSLLDGDVFYPFVSKEVYRVKFGDKMAKNRTFIKLSKDSFCGTGIVIIKKGILLNIWEKIKKILENRKNPYQIAKLLNLDPITILKIMTGRYTVLELEDKINSMFKIKTQGMLTNFANLAFNIDNQQDIKDYQEILKEKSKL
ncbi:MAG: hypothetical protein RMJ36_01990 [Candidatus Calescibacterium sp.]|nr:hypothetical protein [Candidatus Calescibacterium sp.]MDW8132410.1 hypothetical protein [Candidatus Calescibacterium sp.]